MKQAPPGREGCLSLDLASDSPVSLGSFLQSPNATELTCFSPLPKYIKTVQEMNNCDNNCDKVSGSGQS
jgi:hypothetical protein